jgi:hypothetical protein
LLSYIGKKIGTRISLREIENFERSKFRVIESHLYVEIIGYIESAYNETLLGVNSVKLYNTPDVGFVIG